MTIFLITYIIIVFAGLIYLIKEQLNPKKLIYLYIFSVPFFGLMYDIGLQLNIDRIWAFLMFFLLILGIKIRTYHMPICFFLLYAFLCTTLLSQFLPETAKEFPPLRGEYRWIAQLVMWPLLISPTIFISKNIKTFDEIIKVLAILIYSTTILCILGIVQYISFYIFSFDPFPIGLLQEEGKRMALFAHEGMDIFRISSLGGEPKHFAYSIAIILPLLIGLNMLNIKKFRFYKIILLLMFSNLLLTFSTQGYIMFAVNLLILLFMILYKRGITKKVLVSLVLTFVVSVILSQIPLVTKLIKLKTVERFVEEGYVEDWNEAVLGFLKDNPQWALYGVGLGNIHLYAQEYIPEYAYYYMAGQVFVAKSGLLRIVSELGIIGLMIFLYGYIKPLKMLIFAKENSIIPLQTVLSIYTLISFLLTADGPNYIFTVLGLQYALYNITIKNSLIRGVKL